MTESAKQDTTTAPAQPAAAQDDAQPETAASDEAAAAETGSAPDDDAPEDAAPDLDETKRKFREALDRKHQAHNEGQGKGGRDGGKISSAHGPAASRRNFRRKSG